MIHDLKDLRAKNSAAYDLMVEFLTSARGSNRFYAIRKFMEHLLQECSEKEMEAVDLNEVFQFAFFGSHLLVIPKDPFGDNDLLVLKNFRGTHDFESERIVFSEDSFKVEPSFSLKDYIKRCLLRGINRGFLC